MIFSSTLTTCKNSSFILLLSMVLLYNISKNKNQEKTVKKKESEMHCDWKPDLMENVLLTYFISL